MGVGVITDQLVGVFNNQGNTVYALWSESYDKNTIPRTPRWLCMHIGDAESTVKRIFASASDCEGGALQGKSGLITPESHIRRWLRELANPVRMEGSAQLRETYYMERETLQRLKNTLQQHDLLNAFEQQKFLDLDMKKDDKLIHELLHRCKVDPWNLFRKPPSRIATAPEMGYAPVKAKSCSVEIPKMFKLGQGRNEPDILVRKPDGEWRNAGWSYSTIGAFINRYWETELAYPGHYASSIGGFREACQNAPKAPLGTSLVFYLSSATEEQAAAFKAVLEKNKPLLEEQNVGVFESGKTVAMDMSVAKNNYLPWEISELSKTFPTQWIVPETPSLEVTVKTKKQPSSGLSV